jgi:hypothetical protein
MATPPARQPPADEARFTTLKTALANPTYRFNHLHHGLNNRRLTLPSLRALFGHIRKAFLDVLWQQKQLELWMFRSTHLGSEYAQAQSEDSLSDDGRNPGRYSFACWMGESLEMGSGERLEVVRMVVKHVRLFRQSDRRVRELREENERVLASERA